MLLLATSGRSFSRRTLELKDGVVTSTNMGRPFRRSSVNLDLQYMRIYIYTVQ